MNKKIEEYLKVLRKFSIEDLSYDIIYKELICHENINLNGCVKDVLRVFTDMIETDERYINLSGDSILISNTDDSFDTGRKIRLGIFNKLECVVSNIDSLLVFCNKKKIKFRGKLENYDNVGYLELEINDVEEAIKVIDYVNSKLSSNIYSVNPLFFSVSNVMVSLNGKYSYIEILSMYLYRFILKMNEYKMDIDYVNFKTFILENYYMINNHVDMYQYIDLNVRNIKLSSFFSNIDEVTNIIVYLFNGNDYDDFKEYYRKLNRKNSKINNKYLIYDDVDSCTSLFEELVNNMFFNYGEEYTRESVINYMNTGKSDYITRKDNLRKRVMDNKVFMIYLRKISLVDEIDRLIGLCKIEKNGKILEEVCKTMYLNYLDHDNQCLGKIQVARGLIRMQYGDYSAITRNNNARRMAIENIVPTEVVSLIKYSLGIEHVKKEEELYELYAEYIENICIS